MSIESLYNKQYNENNYNCAHFVRDAWLILKGEELSTGLAGLLAGPRMREVSAHSLAAFEALSDPQSPCLALFRAFGRDPHVGIWLNGKVLHLTENGVNYIQLEDVMVCFNQVRFYNVKKIINS